MDLDPHLIVAQSALQRHAQFHTKQTHTPHVCGLAWLLGCVPPKAEYLLVFLCPSLQNSGAA